jgi:hypothetical protein
MHRKLVALLALLLLLLIATILILGWRQPQEEGYDPKMFGVNETLAFRSFPPENVNISKAFEVMYSIGIRKLRMNIWREVHVKPYRN